ncbi:hypothetical protein K1X76_06220 [bacterium]|nr:hypothetical protein [bacterium]
MNYYHITMGSISLLSFIGVLYFSIFSKNRDPHQATDEKIFLLRDENFGPRRSKIVYFKGKNIGFTQNWSSDPVALAYYTLKGHPTAKNRTWQFICGLTCGFSLIEFLNKDSAALTLFIYFCLVFFVFIFSKSYFKAWKHIKNGTLPPMDERDKNSYISDES